MSRIIKDTIKSATMEIGGDEWYFTDTKVELSQASTPNYVDINKMIPAPETEVPDAPHDLIGKEFVLNIDNQIISERDTGATEDTLLFKGNLSNISPTGEKVFEGVAHDPSQQGFAEPGGEAQEGEASGLMNQKIEIPNPYLGRKPFISNGPGKEAPAVSYKFDGSRLSKTSELVGRCADKLGIDERDIQLTEGGVTRSGPGGTVTGAKEKDFFPKKNEYNVVQLLKKIAKITESTYWFDKRGIFHFGVPKSKKHLLKYITDASDGMTTPPYLGVEVIGSGVASSEGLSNVTKVPEEAVISKALVAQSPDKNGLQAILLDEADVSELPEPVFEYRSSEIATDAQADSVALSIAEDLAKQQASGKVTVTGFPEIEILDAIKMPQASDKSKSNYSPRQPMGGYKYSVYKVVHKLNGSDGFKTDIHVAGLVGASRVVLKPEETTNSGAGSASQLTKDELKQKVGMAIDRLEETATDSSGDDDNDSGDDTQAGTGRSPI